MEGLCVTQNRSSNKDGFVASFIRENVHAYLCSFFFFFCINGNGIQQAFFFWANQFRIADSKEVWGASGSRDKGCAWAPATKNKKWKSPKSLSCDVEAPQQ